MPRKPRHEEAGAVHHVYARGVNRRSIFEDDHDRRAYLDWLGYVVRRWSWDCLAYCLMTNHVHLLIRTKLPNLGSGMQRLHSSFAQEFNERHGRIGHLFQDRYGSSRIRSSERLAYIERYIAENPVAARLCSSPAEWPWSSRGALAAGDAPKWLAAAGLDLLQAELARAAA